MLRSMDDEFRDIVGVRYYTFNDLSPVHWITIMRQTIDRCIDYRKTRKGMSHSERGKK
ncbi:uncharacterized protein DS421_6g190340 [Arachis hypogaea]|nr:uncharacterized protein DS421_6g190340 [Arachis hypogaea]